MQLLKIAAGLDTDFVDQDVARPGVDLVTARHGDEALPAHRSENSPQPLHVAAQSNLGTTRGVAVPDQPGELRSAAPTPP